MQQYDFLNLSASEFENLTRDLLQKEFNVHIESFAEGPDGGIDLRFAKFSHNKSNSIVQCKRYKDYNSLKNNLKKEVDKLKKNKIPDLDYFISTSVGLTPNNKKEISKVFAGYLKSEANIFGRKDLNNLLGKYPEVEKQYYKLWLSSANVLNKIFHSKVINQSQFELEKIKNEIKVYVQNDSFSECLKILKDNNFVIISGIPGIGKTTLARLLTYHLLSKSFEEFVYLNDSINEGYQYFVENKKQIFFFDDFLGKNFLENSIGSKDEKNIVSFIEKIQKSTNKILIFTTREYILNQAQLKFDLFDKKLFKKSKCIIDLSKYTEIVKAKILYNHLFFNDIPIDYANEILEDRFYFKLIKHKNYNPRIIEKFTSDKSWEDIDVKKFKEELINFFDYPDTVWLKAFEGEISNLSRYMLMILLSTGTPIAYEDLMSALKHFIVSHSNKYGIYFDQIKFDNSLKELENTFIKTQKDERDLIRIEYQNPSIQDFLVNYLNKKQDIQKDILNSAFFFNQLTDIFLINEVSANRDKMYSIKNKIILEKETRSMYIDIIINKFDDINSSKLGMYQDFRSKKNYWEKHRANNIYKLVSLIKNIDDLQQIPKLYKFLKSRFERLLNEADQIGNDKISDFIFLLRHFQEDCEIDAKHLLFNLLDNVAFLDDLDSFKKFENIYPSEYNELSNSNIFYDKIQEVVSNEFDNIDENDLQYAIKIFKNIEIYYGVDVDNEIARINLLIEEKEHENDHYGDNEDNYYEEYKETRIEQENETNSIVEMFTSLRD